MCGCIPCPSSDRSRLPCSPVSASISCIRPRSCTKMAAMLQMTATKTRYPARIFVCNLILCLNSLLLSLKNYPNGFSVSLSSGLVVVPPPVEDFTLPLLPLSILNSTALAASRIFCLGVKTIFGVFSASFTMTSAAESIIVSSALTRVSDTVRHGYLILFVKGHCDCSVRLPLASYTNT